MFRLFVTVSLIKCT